MVFITLGSQKFQFDRLLKCVDELIECGVITEEVYAQTGYSSYEPKNYKYKQFLDRDEFVNAEAKAEIVITHGGTGAIIGAVKKGKKVIAVPRMAKYGEHVDNHQLQLVREFSEMNIILACYDLDLLGEMYTEIHSMSFEPYQSNQMNLVNSIDEYIKSCFR